MKIIRIVRYVMLYVAAFFAVAHSVLPHIHGKAMEAGVFDPGGEETFISWLKDIIKQDLGEGHLENFVQDADNGPSPDMIFIVFIGYGTSTFLLDDGGNMEDISQGLAVPYHLQFYDPPARTLLFLRGPPQAA